MKYLSFGLNALLIAFFLAVGGLFLAATLPIPGKVELKIVQSGSMEPAIMTGGLVVIQPAASYAAGDVITFGEDTKAKVPTTHRIIDTRTEEGQTFFTTKGDANEEADPAPVYEDEVIGRVLFSLPYAGYILDFARKPLGFALLIGVPAASVILGELWSLFTDLRGARRKREGEPRHVQKRARTAPRAKRAEYAAPVVDLRAFRDPNVLNLRGMEPGAYHRYE